MGLTNEGADVVGEGLDDRADDHDRSTDENRDTTSKTVSEVRSDGGRSESADGLNAVEQTELWRETGVIVEFRGEIAHAREKRQPVRQLEQLNGSVAH